MEKITEERAKLNQFYENLCTYFSPQTNFDPDMYVDYEDAKIGTRYLEARAKYLAKYLESRHLTSIYKKIIINPPATIVIWNDGTKTVVKATENDIYDPEKGAALCFFKKYFGSSYRQILKDANEAYKKKMEEDAELNNSEMAAKLLKGFKDSLTEINNVAHKLIDGGDK